MEEFSPRYVDVPSRRHAFRAARRNLLWGSALLVGAVFVAAFGALISGPRVILWPGVALMTSGALWVLARMRVFRQRNGVFFGIAVVTLGGAILALGECAFDVLAGPRRVPYQSASMGSASADAASPRAAEPLPLLTESLSLTPPDPAEGSRVKVVRNTEVKIGGKSYRVVVGDAFPFEEAKGGEVTFAAGEFRAKIPASDVQILGPQRVQGEPPRKTAAPTNAREVRPPAGPADPAHVEIERRARAEAIRRFPALADKNSPENQEFVRTYSEMKQEHASMLEDPEWPIRLAEFLAEQLKWKQADDTDTEPPPDAGKGAIREP